MGFDTLSSVKIDIHGLERTCQSHRTSTFEIHLIFCLIHVGCRLTLVRGGIDFDHCTERNEYKKF